MYINLNIMKVSVIFALASAVPHVRSIGGMEMAEKVHANRDDLLGKYCKKKFFQQPIARPLAKIHGITHFAQKYYECHAPKSNWKEGDPIFFYCGNENDVELYVNLTGLMWERAHEVNAKLIFAEHRYFGESYPFSANGRLPKKDVKDPTKMQYCTTDLALADFDNLISDLRQQSKRSVFIGFGGSYGGMLCTWLRMKYPGSISGCIAGSAPVLDFEGMVPPFPTTSYAQVQTRDATGAAGAAKGCSKTLKRSWKIIRSTTVEKLQHYFSLCSVPKSRDDVVGFLASVLDLFSMGSYPFPSNYMTWGGSAMLPPYPMRVGCDILQGVHAGSDDALLQRLGAFSAVYYNASHDKPCFVIGENDDAGWALLWNVLTCTNMIMPQGTDGKTDMFWKAPWDLDAFVRNCKKNYGLTPDTYYVAREFGNGSSSWVERGYSNIFFSNGEYDPWITGGVKDIPGGEARSLIVRVIPANGHHADLMFRHTNDTQETLDVRDMEMALIKKWIAEARDKAENYINLFA